MLIVDGQIHLWEKGTPSPQHRQEPFSAEQAIAAMDQAGVDRAMIHPVLWDPDSNELAIEAVRKYPDRFAIMGWFYLDDPNGRDLVARWKERPGMLGLRFYFNERHKREWMTDGSLDWLWPAAERAGVPVALAAALFLPTVGQIAERHPGLKLIVDHMAVPPASRGEAAYRFQPDLLALAKYPNVAVKATGQPGYAEDAYPFRSFHEHLHRVFDAFGPYPIVGAAFAAGINQGENTPPEWKQGAEGYGKRFAADFGIAAVTTTTRYALAEAFKEDTLYYRCDCKGVFPRLSHAVISTFTARRGEEGHRVFSVPALVAPYAGTMTAVYAWYPSRYEPADALRMGNYTLLGSIGGNIALEFFYSGPHSLLSRMHLNSGHGAPPPGSNP